MVKLLIIADDFTGTLDTGIQFAKRGIPTQVFNSIHFKDAEINSNTEVLVINTETRPLSRELAYQTVKNVSNWAKQQGVEMIFKKTDSALRGNIGAELQGVVDSQENGTVFFIPAHPDIDRVIKNGTSYISGQLLEESVFGKDPFEPVQDSFVPDIIKKQSDISVGFIHTEEKVDWTSRNKNRIEIFDSATISDIDSRLDELLESNQVKFIAGCTALADRLAMKLEFNRSEPTTYRKTEGLYIACGSLNEITKKQVEYAEKHGFYRQRINPQGWIEKDYLHTQEGKELIKKLQKLSLENKQLIVDTLEFGNIVDSEKVDNTRFTIAETHGYLAKEILNSEKVFTILMTGGDTLMGFMKAVNSVQIKLVCEIESGAVLSTIEYNGKQQQIISKSGGFGSIDVFCSIAEKIIK